MDPSTPSFIDWGRTRHADATARQLALVDDRLSGKAGDSLVFTEHEPVYTLGLRAGAAAHLLWDDAERARRGIGLEQTGRGGDITYHGPGQIVGYPIVSLAQSRDLHAYLRFLEQVVIDALAELGLAGSRREGLTGIWIGPRKIAAIGVAARRWVTYHGFALNLDPDLTPFSGIVPCGIPSAQGTVTSVAAELGRAPEAAKVKGLLADAFWRGLPGITATR
jgi:lipoyl(octanoyl) transferase